MRIVNREHYRLLYEKNQEDVAINPAAGEMVADAVKQEFGEDVVRYDQYTQKGGPPDFPVRLRDSRITPALSVSPLLPVIPVASVNFVFIEQKLRRKAQRWLETNRLAIIQSREEMDGKALEK